MPEPYDLEKHLASLSHRTDPVRPSPGFRARVMLAIGKEQAGVFDGVLRSSRKLIPALALAAALSVAWAVQAQGNVQQTLAASYGSVELQW